MEKHSFFLREGVRSFKTTHPNGFSMGKQGAFAGRFRDLKARTSMATDVWGPNHQGIQARCVFSFKQVALPPPKEKKKKQKKIEWFSQKKLSFLV